MRLGLHAHTGGGTGRGHAKGSDLEAHLSSLATKIPMLVLKAGRAPRWIVRRLGMSSPRVILVMLLTLSLGPLALLTYIGVGFSSRALHDEAIRRMQTSAAVTAVAVQQQIGGLAELVNSYASRRLLADALGNGDSARIDRQAIRPHVAQLQRARPGIAFAYVTDTSGRVLAVEPDNPELVGRDLGDWFGAVTQTGRTYVSEAYSTATGGSPVVVAAAAPVRPARMDPSHPPFGVLVATYDVESMRAFVEETAAAQDVRLVVTDQRGTVVAAPDLPRGGLLSRARESEVAAALRGGEGVTERETAGQEILSAYTPIPGLGWAVVAQVPTRTAFAPIRRLRTGVLTTAGVLALVMCAGISLTQLALRDRKEAIGALRASEERKAAILDSISEGVLTIDRHGAIQSMNPAMERLAGVRERDGVCRPLSEAVRLVDARGAPIPAEASPVTQALKSGETVASSRHELSVLTHDGRVPVAVASAPLWDLHGRVEGAVAVVHDVSRDREIDKMKSALVSTVSHELRTPLTMIQGFSELLLTRHLRTQKSKEALRQIHRSAQRLSRLIEDLLSVSRIESGRLPMRVQAVELTRIVREVAAGVAPRPIDLKLPGLPCWPIRTCSSRS